MTFPIEHYEQGEFEISTDPARLDVAWVSRTLAATYWAANRDAETVRHSIHNSLCFGVYLKESRQQVGFARVVTDSATFSWICDVVIDDRFRGQGLGKWLMARVVSHPIVRSTNSLLATRDAHDLYERYGFVRREAMRRPADPSSD